MKSFRFKVVIRRRLLFVFLVLLSVVLFFFKAKNFQSSADSQYAASFSTSAKQYLQTPDNSNIGFSDSDFTIATWVRFNTISSGVRQAMVTKWGGSGKQNYALWLSSGKFRFTLSSDGTATENLYYNGVLPVVDTWYYVVAWHDSVNDTMNIQVNNGAVESMAYTGGLVHTNSPLSIGELIGYYHLDGRVDNTGIWGRVLPEDQRTQLYNSAGGLSYAELDAGLKTNLNAWWDLDEESGERQDSVGTSHLTSYNSVGRAEGVTYNGGLTPDPDPDPTPEPDEYAASFSTPLKQELRAADNSSIGFSDSDFTIATWVRFNTLSSSVPQGMVTKWGASGLQDYALWLSGGKFRFTLSSNGAATKNLYYNGVLPAVDTWYYVVAWHDSVNDTMNIQVNDGAVESLAYADGLAHNNSLLSIGALAGTFYLDGRIDNTGIWGKVLPENQRTQLYNSGDGLSYAELDDGLKTNLNAWWDLNEESEDRQDSVGASHLTSVNSVGRAEGVRGLRGLSADVSSILTNSTGNVITLTGENTNWLTSNPTFTLSGGTGASKEAQNITSDTQATVTISAGSAEGLLTLTDPSSSKAVYIAVRDTVDSTYYFNSFDTETVGELPSGWVNLDGANWRVGTTNPVSGNNSLGDSTYHINGIAAYTGSIPVANSAMQFSQKVQLDGAQQGANSGLLMRLSNDGSNGYLFAPDFGDSIMKIFKRVSGTYTQIGVDYPLGTEFADGDVAVIKAEIEGSTLRFKAWKFLETEPTEWSGNLINTAITTPGAVGVYQGRNKGSEGSTTSSIDDFFWGDVGSTFVLVVELNPGNITLLSNTSDAVSLSATDAFGGTPAYTYQWYRGNTSGFTPSADNILTGENQLTLTDTNVVVGETYYYRIKYTDNNADSVLSPEVAVTIPPRTSLISVNDPAWLAGLSPYNWFVSGSSYIKAINPGAYFKVKFDGTSIGVKVDVTGLESNSVEAIKYPRVRYKIDNGEWQTYQLKAGDEDLSLASLLSDTTHDLEFIFLSSDAYTARWSGLSALKIDGLIIDENKTLSPATLLPRRLLAYGDSITEGSWTLGGHGGIMTNYSIYSDSTVSYIKLVADELGAELGNSAFGGQSWTNIHGGSSVPKLPDSWNYILSGQSRLTENMMQPSPHYITVNMGTNKGLTDPSVVTNWLASVRSVVDEYTKIFVIIPFKGTARDNITAGYNNYITDTGNTKTFLIDLGADGVTYSTNATYSYDNLHPNVLGNQKLAELLYQAMLTNVDTTAPVTDVDVDEVAAACSSDPITVTFNCTDDDSGCDTTYYTTDGSTPTLASDSGNSLVLSTTGEYVIKYFSVDRETNVESVRTENISVRINPRPATPPYITKAEPNDSTSAWIYFDDAGDPMEHYELEYSSSSGGDLGRVANIGQKGVARYLLKNLQPDTLYYLRIRAVNGCSSSDWSNALFVRTMEESVPPVIPPVTPPATPVVTPSVTPSQPKVASFLWKLEEKKEEIETDNLEDSFDEEKDVDESKEQSTHLIRIKVTDSNGQPVANAKVVLGSTSKVVFTDEKGFAVFENVEPGNYTVLITYGDVKGEYSVNVGEGEESEVSFELKDKEDSKSVFKKIALIGVLCLSGLGVGVFLFRKTGQPKV